MFNKLCEKIADCFTVRATELPDVRFTTNINLPFPNHPWGTPAMRATCYPKPKIKRISKSEKLDELKDKKLSFEYKIIITTSSCNASKLQT